MAGARVSPSSPASPPRRCSGCVIGALAIRRQGIYFAMITLALAQLVYFVCLEAPFTGGENGLQGIPRGTLVLAAAAALGRGHVLRGAGGVRGGVRAHPARGALALRPGAQGDPRQRAARHLARLRDQPLQAAGVRAVGDPGRACRLAQGAGIRLRDAGGRAAVDLGRCGAHDPARRYRHLLRPGARRGHRGHAAAVPLGPGRAAG